VNAFALREKINSSGNFNVTQSNTPATTNYGYVIKWQGVQSAKAVAQLLKEGIILRYAEQPFEVSGEKFDRGSVIIIKTSNEKFGTSLWDKVLAACNDQKIKAFAVNTGLVDKGYDFGSEKVHVLKAPKVALLTGEGVSSYGAGEVWFFFERELNYPVTLINLNDATRADWKNIDVVIMPAGNYRFLNDKTSAETFKDWINQGGRVIALENAVLQLSKMDWAIIKSKKADDSTDKDKKDDYDALKKFEDREREDIPSSTPGSIFKVELDNSHPLAFGYPKYYYTLKQDDSIYEFMKEGWNVGVIKKDNQVSGFVGSRLKNKLKDGLLFGVQHLGRGEIVYFTENVMFRNFWENGKLMLCNAVFLVGQ
jgi:hypothetical protein